MSESQDQARTRRRWISLAEAVAVAGVIIGGLTLYMNWSEGRDAAVERRAERAATSRAGARFDLRARVADGEVVLEDPRHELVDVTVAFPAPLGVAARQPVSPRIEAGWFRSEVLAATDGGVDEREGRLPVLVTATYRDGESLRTGSGIVDVLWRTQGHVLSGRSLAITGARVRRLGGTQGEVDALWAREVQPQRSRA